MLLTVIFLIAIVSKLIGCGMAAYARGMGTIRSFRVGCGMMSRGEVGLIVTAMGASSGIFRQPEVAVMVTVVLLTTLLTPLAMRGAFQLKCTEDDDDMSDGLHNPTPSWFIDAGLEKNHDSDDSSISMQYAIPRPQSQSRSYLKRETVTRGGC